MNEDKNKNLIQSKSFQTVEDLINKYDIKVEQITFNPDEDEEYKINLYESDLFIQEWNKLLPPSFVTNDEKKKGIEVTFLSHAARPFVYRGYERPTQAFSWAVRDSAGNNRLLSGSFNFAQNLWAFCVINNINNLTNKIVRIQKIGDGKETKYIFNLVK